MDRKIVFPGAIPLETDFLYTNKNMMIGLSKLAEAMFGTGTIVNGLAVAPTAPESLNVSVGAGQIYALENMDDTDYSSLDADIDHTIVKQGILLDADTVSCPAPGTVGYSINYLIQATFEEADQDAVLLPYYNSSNPAQPYSGPNNTGVTDNTTRACNCVVNAKAGTAATTGTQTTPSPDSGYVGIAVVTVAYGTTNISAGNITAYTSKPTLPRAGIAWDSRNLKISKSIAGSGNFTLSNQEAATPIIELTGALTGNVTVVVPDVSCQWVFVNSTTGAYTVYVSTVAAGTDTSVGQTTSALVISTGAASVKSVSGSGGGGVSFVTKTTFTATASQSSFSHTYTVGAIFMVTRNGVSVPYTATSGTAVVLTTAANLNDEVILFEGAVTVVTPSIPTADETTQGIVELASDTEVDAGSDNTRAMTSLKYKNGNKRIFHVHEQQTAGTDGGGFTSGAWRTRALNTSVVNNITSASLAANQVSLPAGTYDIRAFACASEVDGHKTRLYDITNSAVLLYGSTEYATQGGNGLSKSTIDGVITLAGTTVIELQHQCANTKATRGLGRAAGFSQVEVYASVLIRRL